MRTNEKPPYLANPDPIQGHVTVYTPDGPQTVRAGQSGFLPALVALKTEDWAALLAAVAPAQAIASQYLGLGVTVEGEKIFYQWAEGDPRKELHGTVVTRILDFLQAGLSPTPIVHFIHNVVKNPSEASQLELYDFLENKDLPLTPDGCFLAYKAVRADYLDCYSGTIDNSPGCCPSIERRKVDEDRRRECSYGLHVGSLGYIRSMYTGGKVVVVKVNPKDVVSVPLDHNAMKCRVCCYEVLEEFKGEAFTVPLIRDYDSDYDDGDEDVHEAVDDNVEEEVEDYRSDREKGLYESGGVLPVSTVRTGFTDTPGRQARQTGFLDSAS